MTRSTLKILLCSLFAATYSQGEIDREALVTRHNPILREVTYDCPFQVGNGGFAFGVDASGLQTFPTRYHEQGQPTETLSRWAWVTDENPDGITLSDANRDFTHPDGSVHGYPTNSNSDAGKLLRRNPRNHPLGQISLRWEKDDGSEFVPEDIRDLNQTLDLWNGTVRTRYSLGGHPVSVMTSCLPDEDTVAIRLESPLVATGDLTIGIAFPRGHDLSITHTPPLDWSHPEKHQSELSDGTLIRRNVTGLDYCVSLSKKAEATDEPHTYIVRGEKGQNVIELAVNFARTPRPEVRADFDRVKKHWQQFWKTSAAADFSGSSNPLAARFENRLILSQYLTASQMAGDVPPQESGLTCSTWYGKHHTEMIWWHAAHFALWGHADLLAKNLHWYIARLPEARALAHDRGLKGARWAKMVGPDLRESPGGNPLIVWNQPHPIYLAELLYRDAPDERTLETYAQLVQETAEGLASMLWLDPGRDEFVLGPPLWIVQEIYDQSRSQNPSFELAYWRWTLEIAQTWRERRRLGRDESWDKILAKLPALPIKDGKYVALESNPDTWDNIDSRHDHPEMLMALGMMPENAAVDAATMNRTLDAVLAHWDWETKIWGWDYPMIAMTATRLGRPGDALDIILREGPNNVYLPNGHCPQRVSETVRPGQPRYGIGAYLPANGAFLSAASLMIAGWEGCEREHPGFPDDGTWSIETEGWRQLP